MLHIDNLTVAYRQRRRWLPAVRQVSLTVAAGETVGLVGESGSGKTTLALAVMGCLSRSARVESGQVVLGGQNILALSPRQLRAVWGKRIALVPQDPSAALNPSLRVGEQIAELLRQQLRLDDRQARQRTLELLEMVGLASPRRVADNYPHEISGGMQQRVLIALALGAEPDLLVLDEPTTGLDVTTQAVVLDLVRKLIRARQAAALYVTHNMGVVAQLCDRVAVLYAGELVEVAPTARLFETPLHPYTRGLLDSIPHPAQERTNRPLRAIQGQIPSLAGRAQQHAACIFLERCPLAVEICRERPPLYGAGEGRQARCHRWEEILSGAADASQPLADAARALAQEGRLSLLRVADLAVHFPARRRLSDILRRRTPPAVRAVDGVSFELPQAQTLGLVGESGSGKTTLARAMIGLVEPAAGRVELLGAELPGWVARRKLETLRRMQMVFQNPDEALNPYMTVGESLSRPLVTLLGMPSRQARNQVPRLLEAVRLPASYAGRLPEELSGGEKQRVAIARAFAASPDVLICDEPVSALDVSVQASILNLLSTLQLASGNSLLFISHDLAVVGYLADEVAVIYRGRLMEQSPKAELFGPPFHPYTEALLSAIPLPDPGQRGARLRLAVETPAAGIAARGCPFHPRCPRKVGDLCAAVEPPWQVTDSGKRIYCHIPPGELVALQTARTDDRGGGS